MPRECRAGSPRSGVLGVGRADRERAEVDHGVESLVDRQEIARPEVAVEPHWSGRRVGQVDGLAPPPFEGVDVEFGADHLAASVEGRADPRVGRSKAATAVPAEVTGTLGAHEVETMQFAYEPREIRAERRLIRDVPCVGHHTVDPAVDRPVGRVRLGRRTRVNRLGHTEGQGRCEPRQPLPLGTERTGLRSRPRHPNQQVVTESEHAVVRPGARLPQGQARQIAALTHEQ